MPARKKVPIMPYEIKLMQRRLARLEKVYFQDEQ